MCWVTGCEEKPGKALSESTFSSVSPPRAPFLGEPGYRQAQLTLARLSTVKKDNGVVFSVPKGHKVGVDLKKWESEAKENSIT